MQTSVVAIVADVGAVSIYGEKKVKVALYINCHQGGSIHRAPSSREAIGSPACTLSEANQIKVNIVLRRSFFSQEILNSEVQSEHVDWRSMMKMTMLRVRPLQTRGAPTSGSRAPGRMTSGS